MSPSFQKPQAKRDNISYPMERSHETPLVNSEINPEETVWASCGVYTKEHVHNTIFVRCQQKVLALEDLASLC